MHLLKERIVSWEELHKLFKNRYLSEQYYDDHAKKSHELRLGKLMLDKFMAKFTNLLQYVTYIKEEKSKV